MSSNCTFMELKSTSPPSHQQPGRGSNCTFMELKSASRRDSMSRHGVLIVPLWN